MKKKTKNKLKEVKVILNKKNDFKIYELLLFGFLTVVITASLTFLLIHEFSGNPVVKGTKNKSSNKALKEFVEVYELLDESYYDKINYEKAVDGAINGLLSSLNDPHTSYFNASDTESFNELMNGSYEGIGAEITTDENKNIVIASVFKNSPAHEEGLKAGDIIVSVNGTSTKGLTTTETVALIKDAKKPIANMKMSRDNKEFDVNIKKRVVIIESVESKIYDKGNKKIGYILINNFANNTYIQFKNEVEKLEASKIQGLVIDVRSNTGGYLHAVTSMLEMLLSKGKVLYQIQDKLITNKYTDKTSESRNYPIAVLINKYSASASEILAIGLKEAYDFAYVVGTNSYGKGTVQTTMDLKSGAMIKYTIQKWLSPKGNWINEKGVEPTHKVELSEEYLNNPKEENDNQLNKALDLISNSK